MTNLDMATVVKSIQTENIVASSSIGQEVDLESLADSLEEGEYDPSQFPGLVYRTTDPRAAFLLFRSGKLVCTGVKSINGVHQALWVFFEELRDCGIDVPSDPDLAFQNLVASADLNVAVDLNTAAVGLGLENVEIDTSQFPGLVYQLSDPFVVILLFSSGKVVVTGARRSGDIQAAIRRFAAKLQKSGIELTEPSDTESNEAENEGTEKDNVGVKTDQSERESHYDVFISHASEDKEEIVRPLAQELSDRGIRVWYDEFELSLGDSLRESIDQGLTSSEYGIVVLSENFFDKKWTNYELNSLVSRHMEEDKVILPLWHEIDQSTIRQESPLLADLLAEEVDSDNISAVAGTVSELVSDQ
ncbi:hypothetical protein GCM10028857_13320 [Salinarchaeum chitinilyticum]